MNECTKKACGGCKYSAHDNKLYICDYFVITGRRRGCPAGAGCTKKELGKKARASRSIKGGL